MKIPKKYIYITGLSLSLSGSILGLAYLAFYLDNEDIIRKEYGIGFLIFYVFYILYMMVKNAVSKKD